MLRLTTGLRTDGRDRLHFSVQTTSRRQRPVGVRYDWQNGCLYGVSFARRDAAVAEAWIVAAITAGYRPLYNFRKRGSGYCPNEISKLMKATP